MKSDKNVHFILQGKGGVGKSLVSSILMQYLIEQKMQVCGYDTDPINSTFSGYSDLDVEQIDIMVGDNINQINFDVLIENIINKSMCSSFVVDNGASSFVPLCSYLKENDVVQALRDNGINVFFHSVMTGGQAVVDTANGVASLATHFESVPLVIWLNGFFGEIKLDGKSFEDFGVYQQFSSQFYSLVKIPQFNRDTFGKNIEELLARRETFNSAISGNLPIMTRQRLTMFWRAMQAELDTAGLV